MKKDISFLPVEGISIAVARENPGTDAYAWNVYLINQNTFSISDIMIRSKGYGEQAGQHQATSTLRHHFGTLASESYVLIEPITPEVFHLYNEYWISYFVNGQIFDKKYIFVPESIIEENLIFIPQLKMQGILHT
jgi:hypothetical protein